VSLRQLVNYRSLRWLTQETCVGFADGFRVPCGPGGLTLWTQVHDPKVFLLRPYLAISCWQNKHVKCILIVSDRGHLWQLLKKRATSALIFLRKRPINLSPYTVLELRFSGCKESMQISLYAPLRGLKGEKCHFHFYTDDSGDWDQV